MMFSRGQPRTSFPNGLYVVFEIPSIDKTNPMMCTCEKILTILVHPGYSAEECFKRIDSHLRKVLNRKHVPIVSNFHPAMYSNV